LTEGYMYAYAEQSCFVLTQLFSCGRFFLPIHIHKIIIGFQHNLEPSWREHVWSSSTWKREVKNMGWFHFSAIIHLGFVVVLKYHAVHYWSAGASNHAKILWKI